MNAIGNICLSCTHTHSNEMECSPLPLPIISLAARIPLREIAQRLADSLHPDELFPESNYLQNVKAELRKLMKQRYVHQRIVHLGSRGGKECTYSLFIDASFLTVSNDCACTCAHTQQSQQLLSAGAVPG